MNDFKEFQFGWLIFIMLIPAYGVIIYLYLNEMGDKPMGMGVFLLISFIIILVYLLFYGMTTMVNTEWITVSFGVGIVRRRIQISRIKNVVTVKNPWYYGWGIRLIPKGMLYNISGSEGVELTFIDTERVIRIGSANSSRLKEEISKRLA